MTSQNNNYRLLGKALGMALAASAAWSLSSCDKVDEDDRLIYVAPAEVSAHVLIEDFTGQSCINCPAASDVIAELQETYGHDNVIAVGLYSGPFGKSSKGIYYPLTTETGDYYYEQRGIEAQPCGSINRGAASYNTAEWATVVRDALQQTSPVSINCDASLNSETNNITADITIGSSQEYSDAEVNVWLIEDNVTSWQLMPGNKLENDYTHNHVFRTALTAADGDAVSISPDSESKLSYSLSLSEADVKSEWDTDNLSMVVFASNSNGVLQVINAKINIQ